MCINLSYCLVCPLFLLQDTRLCHGASKAPRRIFICVVLRNLLCLLALLMCLLKSAHIASRMSAPYASKKSTKMGLKDLKLFPVVQISVTKIQGRPNTRQNCSTVDAALKENFEVIVFIKVCGPLAQAKRRS